MDKEKSIITNDKCISCSKNLRTGIEWNKNAYLQTCCRPYFYADWNDSKHHENPDCCNLCYYTKEFLCCKKYMKLCKLHEKLTEMERYEILCKINNNVEGLELLDNIHNTMREISDIVKLNSDKN